MAIDPRLFLRMVPPSQEENRYPDDWEAIAQRIKDAAGWKCERCQHPHDPPAGYTLTVHHLDMVKSNCEDWNLAALCQRCHLRIQSRVDMKQLFFEDLLDVSPWFRPHLDGYLDWLRRMALLAGPTDQPPP